MQKRPCIGTFEGVAEIFLRIAEHWYMLTQRLVRPLLVDVAD